ncbi:MAG: right-handed parallel beta-helix repeat-containing protein, partial [Patescibacteria group bacterium]|nr:right-handed parallel beta-helix repeat-containing protein [Patescibacteria group bacterium]
FIPFDVPDDTPALAGVGHIVRRNTFLECGVCSLSGLGLIGGLVEANYSEGCGWQRCGSIHECAGIKLHYLKHSLARRNVVVDPVDASGLWIDHSNANSRATENIILGGNGAAGIFFEASYRPNLVDHNIVWGFDGNAIIIQHTSRLAVVNNLFGACTKKPVQFTNSRTRPRILDVETQRPAMGMGNLVASNVFYGFGNVGPNLPDGNLSDGNLFVNPPDAEPFDLDAWRQKTWQEKNSMASKASMSLSRDDWTLRQEPLPPALAGPRVFEVSHDFVGTPRPPEVDTEAGPFLQVNLRPEIRLAPK